MLLFVVGILVVRFLVFILLLCVVLGLGVFGVLFGLD